MNRRKAALTLDPFRRDDQVALIHDRAEKIIDFGDQIWGAITDDQAALFTQKGIQVQFHDSAGTVMVPSVAFIPPDEPAPPDDLRAQEPSGTDTAYYIVEFAAPPDASWFHAVAAFDAVHVADVPALSAVFRMTAEVAAQVKELTFIDWVGIYHPAYALSYQLAGHDQRLQSSELASLQVDASKVVTQESASVQITFFSDVASADRVALVQATGATVALDTGNSLLVDATVDQVRALLRISAVQLVDAYRPAQPHNHRGRIILGANQVQALRSIDFLVNLDGTGETAGVIDTGIDTGVAATLHEDLRGRVQILPNLNGNALLADTHGHGTHVSGSIICDGTKAAAVTNPPPNHSIPRGIAPAASVIFQGVLVPPGPRNTNYGNYIQGLENAHQSGARVHCNSYGAINGNNYSSQSVDIMAYLRPESLLLFSSGNDEADLNNDGVLDQNFLGSDGVSKNILTIGACENVTNTEGYAVSYREFYANFRVPQLRYQNAALDSTAGKAPRNDDFPMSDNANDIAMFSNRGRVRRPAPLLGPAPLGRVKPDLVAPGTNIMSTRPPTTVLKPFDPDDFFERASITQTAASDSYFMDSGTSMATPIATGAAVLTRQFYRARFGQLRRPQLLEAETQFTDLPAAASHPTGCVLAWIRRDVAGLNHVAAAIYTRGLVRQTGILQLQTNVGVHPAIQVASHGAETVLIHRSFDSSIKLSKYDSNLAPVAAFGTAGVVTLAPLSRIEDNRRPSICVHADEIAVVWTQTATDTLLFQRFNANTGAAIDAAAVNLGSASYTSANPYVLHNGTQYAILWGQFAGANHQVLLRFVDGTGNAVGANPISIVSQPQQIRDPHLTWDTRQNRYLAVWVSTVTHAGGDLITVPIKADGTLDPALTATAVILSPEANTIRQPFVATHPVSGYVLAWEDDTQNSSFDLYVAFLDASGHLEGTRITERDNRLRISDTPKPTSGFAAFVDPTGFLPVWQSNDEINSDLVGIYALSITPKGTFQAQSDPNVPLLDSGRYVRHQLIEHAGPQQTGVALAWAGGSSFFLRAEPRAPVADLMLVRVTADGAPDLILGPNGARKIDSDARYTQVCLKFAGTHLIAAATRGSHAKLLLFDSNGAAIATFGTAGVKDLGVTVPDTIFPQLDFQGTGPALKVLVAFGVKARSGSPTIRFAAFDVSGVVQGTTHDLSTADGTARHGWFYFAASSTRLIAVWHQKSGAATNLTLNLFNLAGAPQNTPALQPTAVPGTNQNASLAPRRVNIPGPVAGPPPTLQLEYGLVWQRRPTPADRWVVLFSQLDVNGQAKVPSATIIQDRPVASSPTDHCTDPQLVWHTSGYGFAWLQQPSAGGNHVLFFATMDSNGVVTPAPFFQVSDSAVDVQDFQLVWNGRRFAITWTETSGGKLRHMQQAIAVPAGGGVGSYDHPYLQPSSSLLRATLINGATNLRKTALPNVGNDPNDGYGWGRINLRQSLSPAPPATFYVRDDNSVANSVKYTFTLPTDTLLLRITLAWTDPPIATGEIVNVLGLKVTTPAFPVGGSRTYIGNNWKAAPDAQFSNPVPAAAPPAFESIHNVQQVVIPGEATLPAGQYIVEVIAAISQASLFQQFNAQPFSLVFVGSGREWIIYLPPTGPLPFY